MTPAQLAAMFASSFGVVLAYVGATVAAAIVGTLTFFGIRKGLGWGLGLLRGGGDRGGMSAYDRREWAGWGGDEWDGRSDESDNIEADLRRDGLI